ncbi:molecular chaperone [Providencia vermicola]|uniref:Fimbria/pilus periplasmic chaperone n=1 Tax=Providencia vermicola TaxID=333965 RepID=A0AAX3S096_9GAMM|nr:MULTISPECIES: fimbria/pilus periplasmic chaperone [Providencia]ELX8379818.1 fimbria/pilus periplasmic chaperone [Providencia stuartii]EMD5259208.1 fimbria/pilus periplasmic chaperone [Providencia stuartii]MBG5920696.1 fimbria/pilus periplasmic chaperone [Providencia stuartii]QIC14600.1 fimbria/pilus periplasmic chaperone [Providencia vermicola]USB38313.1 fimbria/pilus periplasmic chaperone [Providencia vermicola]
MLNLKLHHGLLWGCFLLTMSVAMSAYSAITLDRTRIIFPGSERSINIRITNDNPEEAYLAQSWIEDLQGNKLTKGAILSTPPLQRVEANSDSLVRLSVTPLLAQLPQDRESVFYFNLREVPPKSTEGNTLQIALQSRVKLFYRPTRILAESETRWAHKVTLTRTTKGYKLHNLTPFHLTVIGLGDSKTQSEKSHFDVVMVPPRSTHDMASSKLATPYLTYINDYGGKPTLAFQCVSDVCTVTKEL